MCNNYRLTKVVTDIYAEFSQTRLLAAGGRPTGGRASMRSLSCQTSTMFKSYIKACSPMASGLDIQSRSSRDTSRLKLRY